ncbi:lipoprotein insertase outer membrane protein LolB [uncultured Thiothrix sp.]|uniref:lipoprotein insertase outer membrane protein LolB n=1 Tax=uncultured Thiothrix sp. TaxID=223185 RepID=UPI002612BC90|nr:lipoprotein insertase outer membrane protein LolB [uncultured Thiothrix sp.]
MKQLYLALACTGVLSLAGCANQPKPATPEAVVNPKAGGAEAAWQERQRVFAQMQQWQLKGRVGLQLREQSWSFGLDWAQRGNSQYEMQIKNPLTGGLMATVMETGSQVTLKASDGKSYQDTDAERLLAKQLKMNLPLKNLQYWARGIPSPTAPVDAVKLDAYGRPIHLQQAGWVIDYPSYDGSSAQALPSKVQLEKASEQLKAKLVAKEWKTRF